MVTSCLNLLSGRDSGVSRKIGSFTSSLNRPAGHSRSLLTGGLRPPDPLTRSLTGPLTPRSARVARSLRSLAAGWDPSSPCSPLHARRPVGTRNPVTLDTPTVRSPALNVSPAFADLVTTRELRLASNVEAKTDKAEENSDDDARDRDPGRVAESAARNARG